MCRGEGRKERVAERGEESVEGGHEVACVCLDGAGGVCVEAVCVGVGVGVGVGLGVDGETKADGLKVAEEGGEVLQVGVLHGRGERAAREGLREVPVERRSVPFVEEGGVDPGCRYGHGVSYLDEKEYVTLVRTIWRRHGRQRDALCYWLSLDRDD